MVSISSINTNEQEILIANINQPAHQALRAESASAITGRRYPHSGVGEDFLVRRPVFFLRKRPFLRNEKSKNLSEGVKSTVLPRAINRSLTKSGVL